MGSYRKVRLICALLAGAPVAWLMPAAAEDGEQRVLLAAVPAVQPAPDLPPEAAAFRADLRAAIAGVPEADRVAIDRFYAARDYAPFWTEQGSGRAKALLAALDAAGDHGLPRRESGALAVMFQAEPAEVPPAAGEAAATRAFLGFAADLSGGALVPAEVAPEIDLRPERPSPSGLLEALSTRPVEEVLGGLEPADPDYRRLMAEKARLEGLARSGSWGPAVSDGPTLHVQETGPRIAELRARLARLGYADEGDGGPADAFDAGLEGAVQAFQRDHGLVDDGVVGARTLAAVNAPAETRLAQVMVNLERLRWSERDLSERHLLVNIPDYTVTLYEDGRPAWQTRAVVGKTQVTETPEFSGVVSYMVVNPTWHIPDSIAIRDYLPKLQKDPMVLKRQNIRLLTRGGTEINPKLVDFTQYTPENFPFRIKQRPNDDNALGQVKFMFPNEHSVYMHDTPHRELFARDERAFSNGCIRLEQPVELAEMLLAGQVSDPAAAYGDWAAAGKERRVDLERRIAVHITYRTVWFDAGGVARYRADVYGRDAAVFRALEAAGVTLPAAQG
jgi:murein L,D-transpeptidase YcbB/YkuD